MPSDDLRAAITLPGLDPRVTLLEQLLQQALNRIAYLEGVVGGVTIPTENNTLVGSNTVTVGQLSSAFAAGVASINAALGN